MYISLGTFIFLWVLYSLHRASPEEVHEEIVAPMSVVAKGVTTRQFWTVIFSALKLALIFAGVTALAICFVLLVFKGLSCIGGHC